MNFAIASAVVHKVETQWHYPLMIAAGFTAVTQEQTGFVRNYHYTKDGLNVVCVTGVSADYWSCTARGANGYHSALEPFLKGL